MSLIDIRIYLAVAVTSMTCSARADPGDHISLSASGIMTPGLEITIDLETGVATKRTTPLGSIPQGTIPIWKVTTRALSTVELQALKDIVTRSLDEGLRSKACFDADMAARNSNGPHNPPPPVMADSITFFEVQLNGRSGHSPEQFCQSRAFTAVWNAAYQVATVKPSPAK